MKKISNKQYFFSMLLLVGAFIGVVVLVIMIKEIGNSLGATF